LLKIIHLKNPLSNGQPWTAITPQTFVKNYIFLVDGAFAKNQASHFRSSEMTKHFRFSFLFTFDFYYGHFIEITFSYKTRPFERRPDLRHPSQGNLEGLKVYARKLPLCVQHPAQLHLRRVG
jgi:hypothetical protein